MAKDAKGKGKGKSKEKRFKIGKFFKGVWYELKKVSWPTRKELGQHTLVVISSVAVVSFAVWLMDLGLGRMLKLIIK
ncbi:preprotein translocase subunit SecE [Irregularibacter muris]|uniref:Protein translocase subunit SecE n=1 Tax=Irregularibacter muris TaxID=1796619 RepID=A0AAE3KZS0_9FIRM|nr:preprotein translocase subunit SecE [Irregularibacter muris]MCR1898682.1 preprotein translocase subunit SecE [Irregularibacter muris]